MSKRTRTWIGAAVATGLGLWLAGCASTPGYDNGNCWDCGYGSGYYGAYSPWPGYYYPAYYGYYGYYGPGYYYYPYPVYSGGNQPPPSGKPPISHPPPSRRPPPNPGTLPRILGGGPRPMSGPPAPSPRPRLPPILGHREPPR